MRMRHKQPTLVSMWMLDVFCCALGCVTLLWLLNTRFASERADAAQAAVRELLQSQSDRESVQQRLVAVQGDLDQTRAKLEAELRTLTFRLGEVGTARQKLEDEVKSLTRQLATKTKEQEETAGELAMKNTQIEKGRVDSASVRAKIESLSSELAGAATKLKQSEEQRSATEKTLAESRANFASTETKLKQSQAEASDLSTKLAASGAAVQSLTKKLDETNASLQDLTKLSRQKSEERTAAEKMVTDVQARAASLERQLREALKDATSAKTSTTQSATDLAMASGQIKDLDKKLADARALIVDLQGDKSKLSDRFDRLQKDSENRFAGITMTGKRVVFMVDRSGSMDRTSEQVLAPSKWPAVAETVAKVLRSLPDIEQYQVILFSKQAQWLIGDGEWQTYAGEKSAEAVKSALLRTKVEGDTNLFAAFDLAFRMRERGMDTIYLFSDGLPTSGPGLTDELLRRMPPPTVSEQTDALARYVRSQLTTVWNRAFTNQPKVRINAVGFFYESPDLGAFLWALARDNDGSFVGMSRP